MPTVIIPPTDVSPYTGTGDQVLSNTPTLTTPNIGAATGTSVNLSGAGTFGGNLTVSGTGTSSIAGRTQVGVGTATGVLQVLNNTSGSGASDGFSIELAGSNTYFTNYENGPFYWYSGASGASNIATLTAAGALTLAGNLTVSGGTVGTAASTNLTLNGGSSGASLVLGQGSSGTATITGKGTTGTTTIAVESTSTTRAIAQLLDANQATNASLSQGSYMLLGKAASANNSFALMFNYVGAGSSGNALSFQPYGATSVLSIMASGNLLIGTTVDSSGLLQIGTNTTTAAGGMKFGTDVSVYRSNTRELTFLGASTNTFIFAATALGSTVSLKLGDGTNNDQGIIESQGGALVFKRGPYTALTLDSSQNATFAGNVAAYGALNSFCSSTDTDQIALNANTYISGWAGIWIRKSAASRAVGNVALACDLTSTLINAATGGSIFFRIANASALTIDSSKNATFTGTVATQGGTASTPASASATGTAGTILWDASYIYVCTAANTWKRVAIATW